MSSHRWTEGLSRQQLEAIRKDTQEREERYGTNQNHVYKDIERELKRKAIAKAGVVHTGWSNTEGENAEG